MPTPPDSGRPSGPFAHIGGAIRILRTRAGISQGELADRAGITKSQVSNYETRKQRPNLDTLDTVLNALGADILRLAAALGEAEEAVEGLQRDRNEQTSARELRRRVRREVGLMTERYLKLLEAATERR